MPPKLVQARMPAGYMSQIYREKPSSNQLALQTVRHLTDLDGFVPRWITVQSQTEGRGTRGRQWVSSPNGNLYTSLLFFPACCDENLSHLSLIAGIALYDTVRTLTDTPIPELLLKWPNDLMVDGAKLAGILVETQKNISLAGSFAVIGTGLNITTAPDLADRTTTCLKDLGLDLANYEVLQGLAFSTDGWLKLWDRGNNFRQIAEAWITRAQIRGRKILVSEIGQKPYQAICKGIDGQARLILETRSAKHRTIIFNRIEQITLSGQEKIGRTYE